MPDRHDLGIVVPTRDRARLLARLLDSLEAAAIPAAAVDVVVVDDGSTDDTPAVVRRSSLPVRLLNTGGVGPGRARNVGWRATDAPLVLFLDDDCVVSADAVEHLVAALDGNDVVGADIRPLPSSGVGARFMHLERLSRHRVDEQGVRYLVMVATLFRREVLERAGGFDESFGRAGEDSDLSYRLLRDGCRLAVASRATVWHEDRSGIFALWRTYYRHGTAQRRLVARHPQRKLEMRRSVRGRSSIENWMAVYRGYRQEESVTMSAACIGLRAVMMVPWLLGVAVGDHYRTQAASTNTGGHAWNC